MSTKITLKGKKIYCAGVVYLLFPVIVWLINWTRIQYAMCAVAALVVGFSVIVCHLDEDGVVNCEINVRGGVLLLVVGVVTLWCLIGGIGGYSYQTSDWIARNAIYHDLIDYSWPVVYKNGSALCYYFAFWLAPATIGKLCVLIGLSQGAIWQVSNIALLVWSVVGILISIGLMVQVIDESSNRTLKIVVSTLIFFSGMDIIGLLFFTNNDIIKKMLIDQIHIEWWASYYQFSSFTTQLFWVFNQAIPAWVLTLLIYSSDKIENDLYIGILGSLLCPLPTMGLVGIGLAKVYVEVNNNSLKTTLRSLLSAQNLLALIPLVSIVLFFSMNGRSTMTAPDSGTGLFDTYIGGRTLYNVIKLGIFFFLEYGLYLLFLFPTERKNPYWYGVILTLMVCNVTRMGPSFDFEMRASIPGLIILATMIAKHLSRDDLIGFDNLIESHNCVTQPASRKCMFQASKVKATLIIMLCIGSVTPACEIMRAPIKMAQANQFPMVADSQKSFSNHIDPGFAPMGYHDSMFYKYVGK